MFASCCLVALSTLAQLPPPQVAALPPVVLDAPVNATWCANRAEEWRAIGFEGFVFRGIVSLQDPGEEENDSHLIHRDDPLLREIDLAQKRLAAEGMGNNFLELAIPEDRACFTDPDLARRIQQRFRRAGAFAREAGLKGIAIRADGAGPLFDLRYEAYALDAKGVAAARTAAHAFGQRCLRAAVREFRDAEVLILSGSAASQGALWSDFLAGIVDGIGLADSVRLQVVLPSSAVDSPEAYLSRSLRIRQYLDGRFEQRNLRKLWRAYGGLSLSLQAFEGALPRFRPEAFKLFMIAAKVDAPRYVVCHSDTVGWLGVSPAEAAEYHVLHQQGRGAVRPAYSVSQAGAYRVSTPIDGLRRIGYLPDEGPYDYVLQDTLGAVALFWRGTDETITQRNRNRLVHAVSLLDASDQYLRPTEGTVEIPPLAGPVLVSGLSLAEWGVPAAMWLVSESPTDAGRSDFQIDFGFRNPTPARMNGTLNLELTGGASIGNASYPVLLDPDETSVRDRTVRGAFTAGATVGIRMDLIGDDGAIFQRRFDVAVEPASDAIIHRDGAILTPVAIADLRGNPEPEIIVATEAGEIAVYSPSAELVWERRYRTRFVTAPVVVNLKVLGPRIFLADHRGRMWVLDRSGAAFAQTPLPTPVTAACVAFPGSMEGLRKLLAVPLEAGRLCAVGTAGDIDWERAVLSLEEPTQTYLIAGPDPRFDVVYLAASEDDRAELVCVDVSGAVLWQQRLDGALSGSPILIEVEGRLHIVAPLRGGRIQFFDAYEGESIYLLDPGDGDSASRLVAVAGEEEASQDLLIVSDAGIRQIDTAGNLHLASDAIGVTGVLDAGGLFAVDATGDLIAIDRRNGVVRWRQRSLEPQGARRAAALGWPQIAAASESADVILVSVGRELRFVSPPR